MQMEAPKQPLQASMLQQGLSGPPGPPGKRIMLPPQNMPSQQIRGPPPPPYMHQPVNNV